MGELTEVRGKWPEFLVTLTLAVFMNIFLHYFSDIFHSPLYLDKIGIVLLAFVFGPISATIGGIITGLAFATYDSTYLIRFISLGALGLLWGIGFYLARKKNQLRWIYIFYVVGAFVEGILEYRIFVFVMYEPWVSHVLPYTNTINLFTLQIIDALVCFVLGAIILFILGVRDFTHIPNIFPKIKGLFVILILIVATGPAMYYSIAQDTVLVENMPKPQGWKFFVTRMDFVWAPMGVRGTNNYYYPDGRFNKSDPGYQVWVGVYWVEGHYGIYGNIVKEHEIFAFSILDQNAWLSLHGMKNPVTKVHNITGSAWGTFKGYKALFMNGSYDSYSDVPPYEEVVLVGFFIVFYVPKYDRTAIIYACAVDEYYSQMEPILWSLVYEINIP